MSNTTQNTSPLIKGQIFSDYILTQILDGFLPDNLYRNVSDFGDGDTIFIPVIGETVIRDYAEDQAVVYDPIDTGQVSLVISEYKQGGTYITNKLRQDAYALAAAEAQIPTDHLRKIQESFETGLLALVNSQTLGDPNTINGFDHRWVAGTGSNNTLDLEDFLYAKLSADKKNWPDENRIVLVDPISEAALNKQVAGQAFVNNPMFEGMVTEGFARGKRFVRNIFGWDVWTTNRLPRVASETITGGPQAAETSVTDGVVNIFMSAQDDQHIPFMGAWRQMPKTDGEYNKDRQRDEYVTTARWGLGLQRRETLMGVVSSATSYK